MFVNSLKKDCGWRSLDGKQLARIDFDNMKAAGDFVKEYKEVENAKVYGLSQFEYVFLNEEYPGMVNYDPATIRVLNIDIEIDNEGLPMDETIQLAKSPVTAITIRQQGKVYQFGCGDYTPKNPNAMYFRCLNELDLLSKFLRVYERLNPDALTGWNIEGFDMIYLYRRIVNLYGKDHGKRLSPWGVVYEESKIDGRTGKEYLIVNIGGVAVLDYMILYKKFTYSQQESYALNHIAHVELGKKKLDYSDYENLYDLSRRNFQLFMEYNDIDTALVEELDAKMGFINQVYAIAYDAHVNYADALTSVRLWDIIIYRKLSDRKIAVNPKIQQEKTEQIAGAYVKEPKAGRYKWVVSDDLDSLYPHLIMGANISPETLISAFRLPLSVEDILEGKLNDPQYTFLADNHAVAGSGWRYSREFKGFLAELMFDYYNDRKVFKKKMLEAESEYERTKDPALLNVISLNNNMQMAKKIQLNSAYGALSNQYFRWYDDRLAESITLSGQVAIRYLEKNINLYLNKRAKTEGVDYIIASDTDSIYMNLERIVELEFKGDINDLSAVNAWLTDVHMKDITPEINRIFDELAVYLNSFEQKMSMKLETIADSGIWTGKKRYILNALSSEGVVFDKPKVKVKGIEIVKSSTPQVVRSKLKEAVGLILTGTEDSVIQFIETFRQEHLKLPFEDIAFPRSVSKLSKYRIGQPSLPIHCRASLVYNQSIVDAGIEKRFQAIQDGDKIKFSYLKVPNPVFSNVIASPGVLPKPLGLEEYIDYYTMFEKTFMSPLKSILDVCHWRTEKRTSVFDLC